MRLGGPIFAKTDSPDSWAASVTAAGYRAAFCPVAPDADNESIKAYAESASKADIVIAEVGAWSNPLGPDTADASAALEKCKASLALADRIGARCCVNIAGSCGKKWDGPDSTDLTKETFDRIVCVVRDIIDAVKPTRSFYALETMPWMYPDSPEAYLRLVKAIDRKGFAVHLDPVNLVCSPQRYFANEHLIEECFEKLGEHIKSCHAKDIILRDNLTVHLDEVRPGQGNLDYTTFLRCLNRLDPDIPLMLEHLPNEEEYCAGASHIRGVAAKEGFSL
ncbi:MAG: TIM barrel protein [Verrucomicrobia bacterium]|nr:TIM barrel protein [Verrucomicrobiota bacterium]MDA1088231.1 TIM barrel protein [Verrucomicrobiota bacterium]